MALPAQLQRSKHISWFAHMGAVYLFHDLYGYLMEMSPDIADLVEAFAPGPTTTLDILGRFGTRFEGADPAEFLDVLVAHAVLLEPDEDELDNVWAFVPIKGKWNTWQRTGDRLRLYTAWGDRPITELMLDADETRMWDAFDGEKRMNELKLLHDPAKLAALVRRLTHSDVQALKLSMMPWSAYSKRPGMAPPYLASTMPYHKWMPGTSVPAAVSLSEYHRETIGDANEQFDHQETTLSHLLRIPHPTLSGRTYGEALADALKIDRDVRVLEIGAGLGYVARDVIARLGSRVRTYTIVELSPALMAAQQKLLGDRATWIAGDALEVALPEADLIICNEMVGDLPARQLSRADIGMNVDMSGEVDLGRLRAYSVEAVECNVKLDDAPEPFYLQYGAFALVAKIARALAPGGTAVITEFGSPAMYPKLSSHLDHPELSTHFGQLLQVAKGSGLDASLEFVIDLLDFQRDEKGLVTTRSQFRALRSLCSDAGIDLVKLGYTPALLDHAVAGKLDLTTVGDLRWDRIEDRLMGLVPHEFKALLVSKPS
ncbi:MAG TPA: SAM-dependent methyltransferase [Kofleriaceae bacterium]|jgi:SAM-dependent methyltransferase|nr:SAM-dependent methyltransferase [Kofleriaceae bacterium]